MKSFTLIFLVLWIWNAYYNVLAQITFEKTFGGTQHDLGLSVQQTSDEGYIITGHTLSFGAGARDVYLIKTNSDGEALWTKTFGGIGFDEGHCVQQTSDGGYVITGVDGTHYPAGVYLIKTDASGDTLWTKTFSGSGFIKGEYIVQTKDSGFAIVGYKNYSDTSFSPDICLIKTNSSGNIQWTKTYGDNEMDFGHCVQLTNDGGYIIVGSKTSTINLKYDVYLIKTNENGDTLWTRTYGGTNHDTSSEVRQTNDSGYVIVGATIPFGADNYNVYFLKTNINGDTVWTKTYGGSSDARGSSVQQTIDGGYIIAGYLSSFGSAADVYLIKTDVEGNTLWTKTFGGNSHDYANSVQQTSDSGYIITGWTWSSGAGRFDVYLIKTDDSGIVTETSVEWNATNDFALNQNYPNPFNPTTNIEYIIPSTSRVVLKIYNILGQLITTLVDEQQAAGRYKVQWQAKNFLNGVYLYRLETGDFSETKKLVLLK